MQRQVAHVRVLLVGGHVDGDCAGCGAEDAAEWMPFAASVARRLKAEMDVRHHYRRATGAVGLPPGCVPIAVGDGDARRANVDAILDPVLSVTLWVRSIRVAAIAVAVS